MLNKEYDILNKFINGTLDDKTRIITSEMINKNYQNSDIETNSDETKFNPENAWMKLQNKIDKESNSGFTTFKSVSKIRIAASIIIVIGIMLTGILLLNPFATVKYAQIKTGNEIKELKLSDGSVITLNRNSVLKYPETFASEKREIEFSGEAYFEIAKNPQKPFIIKTNDAEIKVLGTSFNVRSEQKNEVIVNVNSGKVQLVNKNNESLVLTKNETGKIENNTLTKNINSDLNYSAWKTKHFIYENVKLNTVINDLNRVYQTNIVFKNLDIGEIKITTEFVNKPIDSVIEIICVSQNLKYKQSEETTVIYK
jgi:ferric-dicitrate binding protein FerR (iron transport regulator)